MVLAERMHELSAPIITSCIVWDCRDSIEARRLRAMEMGRKKAKCPATLPSVLEVLSPVAEGMVCSWMLSAAPWHFTSPGRVDLCPCPAARRLLNPLT